MFTCCLHDKCGIKVWILDSLPKSYLTVYAQTLGGLSARNGSGDGSEEWGYIPVRPGASMFYWFYRSTHPDGYLNRPIVLWLQGGPGLSGTGLGNFLMFGPLDQNLEPRNSTWAQTVNVLFVDSPVDVGFSVAHNRSFMPQTTEEISTDLITILQTFMQEHSYFQNNPFYIFGQSYGGKLTAALTYYLHKAIQSGHIQCNLKGAGIGNGYVSPADFIVTLAPMLYQMSLIDDVQYKKVDTHAWQVYNAAKDGNWTVVDEAVIFYRLFSYLPETINPYNIIQLDGSRSIYSIDIVDFMNGPIREKLGVIPEEKKWDMNWRRIKYALTDHDQPAWHLVDEVLKSSDIDIVVYQGQLDMMCNTAGALRWMNKLTWNGTEEFGKAERKMLTNPDTQIPEMFVKAYGHLKMYWILNSGHVVPRDVPDVALRMLNRILDDTD